MKNRIVPDFDTFVKENLASDIGQQIKKGAEKVRDFVLQGVEWFKALFNHPEGVVSPVKGGGKKVTFMKNGKPAKIVYDFSGTTNESKTLKPKSVGYQALKEHAGYDDYLHMMMYLAEAESLEMDGQMVRNIDIDGLNRVLKRTFYKQKNMRPFIWGAPGIGKTQIIEQFARENGIGLQVMVLSQMNPEDFAGIPFTTRKEYDASEYENPNDKTQQSGTFTDVSQGRALPDTWPRSNRSDGAPMKRGDKNQEVGGIIFLDELNTAPGPVLNTALRLMDSGKIPAANYTLPDKWIIVSAGNRDKDIGRVKGGGLTKMSVPMRGRLKQFNFAPSFKSWVKNYGMKDADKSKTPWMDKNIAPEIIAFLNWKKEYFHYIYPEDQQFKSGEGAYPSPRTWASVSNSLQLLQEEAEEEGKPIDEEDLTAEITSIIGGPVAVEFVGFYNVYEDLKEDLDKYDNMWSDPQNTPLPPNQEEYTDEKGNKQYQYRDDLAYAFAIMMTDKKRDANIDEAVNFLKYLMRVKSEQLALVMLGHFMKRNPKFKTYMTSGKGDAKIKKDELNRFLGALKQLSKMYDLGRIQRDEL